jgi:hypothetical protein
VSNVVYVREYTRRRPEKSPQYRALSNRLYDEVMFIRACDRQLEEELAASIEEDLEDRNV